MGKRKSTEEIAAAPAGDADTTATPTSEPAGESKIASASELPGTDAPLLEASDELFPPSAGSVQPEPNRAEPPKPEWSRRPGASPDIEPARSALVPYVAAAATVGIRLPLLAATVALAAAFGALVGVLGASSLMRSAPAEVVAQQPTDSSAAAIAKLRSEVAALKTSIETARRSTTAQFAKTSDRLDKIDRGQAEPNAKLAKLAEAIERLEHRPEVTGAGKDTTGSIVQPQPIAAAVPAPALASVPGWSVRGVYGNIALLQGRLGLIEVETGDVVPGIGRIESIRRQDNRWVVATSKGVIVSAQR